MNKKNNGFKTLLLLIGLNSLLLAACHKDPTPQPQPTPTDSIPETPATPIEPKNDTIFWNLTTNPTWGPSAEVVREHLNKPNTKNVVIHVYQNNLNGEDGLGKPMDWTYYQPALIHLACEDWAQNAFAEDSVRTILYAMIEVTNVNAPGHGWEITEPGVTSADKARIEGWGGQFIILDGKKAKTPNHGFTPILPRAITNNGKTR